MSQNPYSPPPTISPPPAFSQSQPGPTREYLLRVAMYQRFVLFSLLANIVINIVAFTTVEQAIILRLAVVAVAVIIVVLTMVSIFLLANEIMNVGVAIFCAILMIVPCVSLIAMLIVNQKATTILQASGIKVGLMGANTRTI